MKNFKIGVISDLLKLPFEESIQKSKEIGVSGVQLYAVSGLLNPDTITADEKAFVKRVIAENGLEISALCGDLGGGFGKAEQNPPKIEKSKRIVDLALELGTNIITTHIGVVPEDFTCDTFKNMQQACNQLAEYANAHNAYFAIETGPEPSARLKRFLDSLDCKGVAVNLDPANLAMVIGEDAVEAVHNLKDYIVHTHAKDGKLIKKVDPLYIYEDFDDSDLGGEKLDALFKELPLGQGQVDFAAYLAALEEIGYSGYLTIEREVGGSPEADIRLAVDFLNNLIK